MAEAEDPPALSAQDIAELALRDITHLTGKKSMGATAVTRPTRLDGGGGGDRGSAHPVLDGHARTVRGGVGYGWRIAVLSQNSPLYPRCR